MARRFFYVAAGMLMLALSYHFGASTAGAQAPGNSVVAATPSCQSCGQIVFTANGDVYSGAFAQWQHVGNVFTGSPTPALQESWGQVKSRYAPNRGSARPGADTR